MRENIALCSAIPAISNTHCEFEGSTFSISLETHLSRTGVHFATASATPLYLQPQLIDALEILVHQVRLAFSDILQVYFDEEDCSLNAKLIREVMNTCCTPHQLRLMSPDIRLLVERTDVIISEDGVPYICEQNSGPVGGMNWSSCLMRANTQAELPIAPNTKMTPDTSVNELCQFLKTLRYDQKRNQTALVVNTYYPSPTLPTIVGAFKQAGFRTLQFDGQLRYHETLDVTSDGLIYLGIKIDVLYYTFHFAEHVTGKLFLKVVDLEKSGKLIILPSPGGVAYRNKALLHVLSCDEISLPSIDKLRENVPWSRLLCRSVYFDGGKTLESIATLLRNNKDKYVLKKLSSSGGKGVYVGKDTTEDVWHSLIADAVSANIHFNMYIAQEYIRTPYVSFLMCEEDKWKVTEGYVGLGVNSINGKFCGLFGRYSNNKVVNFSNNGGLCSVCSSLVHQH